jgi:kynureninase
LPDRSKVFVRLFSTWRLMVPRTATTCRVGVVSGAMAGSGMGYSWTRERSAALDRADPLRAVRDRFVVPEGVIYLDGHSLGALPGAVAARVAEVIEQEWGTGLVRNWDTWMSEPSRVGDKIARLIGARAGEVIVVDTTTIALAKLLGAALAARPDRRVIVTTAANFPSDLYAADGVARLFDVEVRHVDAAGLAAALDESVAVLMLTHVDFRTGAMFDMGALTTAAHEVGALTVWDLCHSVGAVAVDCERDAVDLAVGCCYKYLNAGPGAPAFVYVRRELQGSLVNPLPGWLGHETPFDFAASFRPASGIRRFVTSTPSVLGLAALDAALDAWEGVTTEAVRAKSVALSELFIEAVLERAGDELELASPRASERRGSHVSLRHPEGYAVVQALIARGVVGDFRAPDLCRFGFAPLYLRFTDVFDAAEAVVDVVSSHQYEAEIHSVRRQVT